MRVASLDVLCEFMIKAWVNLKKSVIISLKYVAFQMQWMAQRIG